MINYRGFKQPVQIARGVDPRSTQIQPPGFVFQPPQPINTYHNLAHQDTSLMGFNQYGHFTGTVMNSDAQHFGLMNMQNNNSIIGLVNGKRRGLF